MREELLEKVITLQDRAATIGRDVNDQLRLVSRDSLVNEVCVHCLKWQLVVF